MTETITGAGARTKTFTYEGEQLTSVKTGTDPKQLHFHDADGNLDCVTLEGATQAACSPPEGGEVSAKLLADYAYDYLNRIASYRSFTTNGTTSTKDDETTYVYDALDRVVEETEDHGATNTATRRAEFVHLGLTDKVTEEKHLKLDGTPLRTKSFGYDAYGHRISFKNTPAGAAGVQYTYGYDVHGSVSITLDGAGATKSTYGYRPYGEKDAGLTTGESPNEEIPLNPYRYTAKRYDTGSKSLDMGARRFGPDTTRFLQRDYYNGALADLALSFDPLTQNRYSLAGGNPMSFIESDGHAVDPDGVGGSPQEPNPTDGTEATQTMVGSSEGSPNSPSLEASTTHFREAPRLWSTYERYDWTIQFIYGEMIRNAQADLGDSPTEQVLTFAALVRPGGRWDHKPQLAQALQLDLLDDHYYPIRESSRRQFGRQKYELYYDVWSNIHYGYVGRAQGLKRKTLDRGATLSDAGRTDQGDRISVEIGMDLWDQHQLGLKPEHIQNEILGSFDEYLWAQTEDQRVSVLLPFERGNRV